MTMSLVNQILIIDDDREICIYLSKSIKRYFDIDTKILNSGKNIKHYLKTSVHNFDIILLDLMMPQIDGIDTCRYIREVSDIPIIMMTCLNDNEIKPVKSILAFEAGVDDCISKPINPAELIARCSAILRRTKNDIDNLPVGKTSPTGTYTFENWQLNTKDFTLTTPDKVTVFLSTGEYDLLLLFLNHPRQVLSRDFLTQKLRSVKHSPYDRSIDVRISLLRKRLHEDGTRLIRTVYHKGYMLNADVTQTVYDA